MIPSQHGESAMASDALPPPPHLPPDVRAEWLAIAPAVVAAGSYDPDLDSIALELLCVALADWRRIRAAVEATRSEVPGLVLGDLIRGERDARQRVELGAAALLIEPPSEPPPLGGGPGPGPAA